MSMEGVMYWGCESPLHRICIEADQTYRRTWSDVLSYLSVGDDDLYSMAMAQEGDICLTPLAIVASEGPPSVVSKLLQLAPEATATADRYGETPLHRAALQHRDTCCADDEKKEEARGLSKAATVMKLLRDANPSTLVSQDKYGKTPLHCAVESSRGFPSLDCIQILLGTTDDQRRTVALALDKKQRTALDILKSRGSKKATDEQLRHDILHILQKFE